MRLKVQHPQRGVRAQMVERHREEKEVEKEGNGVGFNVSPRMFPL